MSRFLPLLALLVACNGAKTPPDAAPDSQQTAARVDRREGFESPRD